MHSVNAIEYANIAPKTPGLYLAYFMKKLFKKESHFLENSLNIFHEQPDELELEFDKYLTKILSELSNGTAMNVSLLDMSGFGSKYQGNCNLNLSWAIDQM